MAFLDEARGQIPAYNINRCNVHKWLQTQADLTDQELRDAAAAVSISAVMRAMQKRGYPFKRTSVERHINGECSC